MWVMSASSVPNAISFERTVRLGTADPLGDGFPRPIVLTVKIHQVQPAYVALDFDLNPLPETIASISFCGYLLTPDGSASEGWMEGDIFGGEDFNDPNVRRLVELLRYWSRNTREGCRAQIAALGDSSYLSMQAKIERLEECGLVEVPLPEQSRSTLSQHVGLKKKLLTHYRFGSANLVELAPPEVIDEIQSILSRYPEDPFREE
jgi:hypothetical protein